MVGAASMMLQDYYVTSLEDNDENEKKHAT